MADPDCVGDLLLVGLVIARWVDLDPAFRSGRNVAALTDEEIERAAFGTNGHRAAQAMMDDIRRYDPAGDTNQVARCGSPFNGAPGTCPLPPRKKALLPGPGGAHSWVGSCLTHAVAFNALVIACGAAAAPVTGPANSGGVLSRHLPEIDWPAVYRMLDTTWRAPTETDPKHPLRPHLRLINRR